MGAVEVFLAFLKLGLTSFGGPIAHLGYIHGEFVARRKWLNDAVYADLVALCQLLPGPASSQVGIAIGLSRAGYLGAIAAWLGFTLPSAIILILVALSASHLDGPYVHGLVHGLKIAAVAVIAQAIWVMGSQLSPDKQRATLAIFGAVISSLLSPQLGQIVAIVLGAFIGWALFRKTHEWPHESLTVKVSRKAGAGFLICFTLLLLGLPLLVVLTESQVLAVCESFFRTGSLVFGGGHVALPLLQAAFVAPGWVDAGAFMAGYGATQAVPGPLFSFAGYLGAISTVPPSGLPGAALGLFTIFLPSFLIVIGLLPFWEYIRKVHAIRSALLGINAAVVGLLLAAFYQFVWSTVVVSVSDFNLALVCFLLLAFWKAPSWSIVALSAICGVLLQNAR